MDALRPPPDANFVGDGLPNYDCHGHGTHVAGTIGGTTYGVAKNVQLYAVRVVGCNGSGSAGMAINGVDWVTSHRIRPAVANMSLAYSANDALDTAVRNSINSGVVYVVAAGNGNPQRDASTLSPARVTEALTVAATDRSDAMADFSYGGPVVDLFAPGVSITSAWINSDTATNIISGTSMAAPHVAGVAALYLQINPSASPAIVHAAIVNNATPNKVTNISVVGTPNRLLSSTFTFGVSMFPTQTPTSEASGQGSTWEQGTHFSSSIGGVITHIRFYKHCAETGTHVGRLWTDSGTLLASVSFANETPCGWQKAELSPHVPISAGVRYRVSFNINSYGVKTWNVFPPPITIGPLTAYGSFYSTPGGSFPTTGSGSNLFADVLFNSPR